MREEPAILLKRIEARIIAQKNLGRRSYGANYPSPVWPADALQKVAKLTQHAMHLRRVINGENR